MVGDVARTAALGSFEPEEPAPREDRPEPLTLELTFDQWAALHDAWHRPGVDRGRLLLTVNGAPVVEAGRLEGAPPEPCGSCGGGA
jgi:hypothetical protein